MLFYIFCLLTMAYAVAILYPETALGRMLDKALIKGLARHLNRMTWTKLVFFIALAIGAVVFSFAAIPAEIALMAAADWALYAEIVATLTVTNLTSRVSASLASIRAAISSVVSRVIRKTRSGAVRQGTSSLRRKPSSAKADEDPAGVTFSLAAT